MNNRKSYLLNVFCLMVLTVSIAFATEYHVSVKGSNSNDGSQLRPFKTISTAAKIAQPGDVITVHAGTYRERINPPRGGESEAKRIVYEAAPGQMVVIKGSEIITDWIHVKDDVWKVILPNSFFGEFNPYSDDEHIRGEWYRTPKDGFNRHPGAVYLNGQWLIEARDLNSVLQPAGTQGFWYAQVDDTNTTIWAQFKDINPNTEMVEINVRQSIFYPDQPGRNYITVRGFTMRQAATPWSGAMSEQIGLIGTHWSKGWIIENNVISHSMNIGITLGRYDLGEYEIDVPSATAPGYVQTIKLALQHGWSKENIGSHIVRNNHISHCERNGIHGSLGGIFSTIEGNTICDIAIRGWVDGWEMAGLKLLGSVDTLIRDNHIYRCGSGVGIWLDWMTQGTRVTGNLLHDNYGDMSIEANHGPFLLDNNIMLSRGVHIQTQGGAYVHNLFAGKFNIIAEDNRQTPYLKKHSTEVAGLTRFNSGDERYFNNIMVNGGLEPYDKAVSPVFMDGNVSLNGAKPSKHETGSIVQPNTDPDLKLEQRQDGLYLHIKLDKTWSKEQTRKLVTTKLLGKAKTPNLLYVQPDGTPYLLDTDYFGKKRNTSNPFPGPFGNPSQGEQILKVWPIEK